ncbi:hypothetical protein MUP05_07155 [Candidatus Bathyarchaeota archaeon]|nr:hypothetical protein [Candidatus Bathyarchaeota archaeon]
MSQEEFNLWLKSSYSGAFYIAGHKFEKTRPAAGLIRSPTLPHQIYMQRAILQ